MAALVVVVVLIVVGALVLVTRGGDEDVELTEAQLEAALVDVDVVGDGFTVSEDSDDGDDDEFDRDEIDASEECIDLYEKVASLSVGADGDVPEAGRTFTRDDNAEVAVTLSGPTEVTLDDVRAIVTTCEEIAVDDGEASGTLRFSELDDVPEVGDERAGVRIDVELEVPFAITVQSATVLWVRDGTQADVSVTGALDEDTFEGQEPDLALLRTVAEAQDAALEQAIDEAG